MACHGHLPRHPRLPGLYGWLPPLQIPTPATNGKDLAARIFNRKKALYEGSNIHFVACSKWLGAQAKQSGLLKGLSVACIPNPIDTQRYKKMDKAEARRRCGLPTDKRVILFVSQRVTLERKGIAYLRRPLRYSQSNILPCKRTPSSPSLAAMPTRWWAACRFPHFPWDM